VGIDDGLVTVDVGLVSHAIVPVKQFAVTIPPETGREIDVIMVRPENGSQRLRANLKGAIVDPTDGCLSTGTLVDGKIVGMIKGGLEVQVGQTRAFMPASHVDAGRVKDISVFLGENTLCEIIEMDRRGTNLVVSRRKALEQSQIHAREKLLAELAVGQIRQGVVHNLTEYGAFVDLGGVHGLVHVSDMSWTPVENPADCVKTGDQVSVKVLKVNRQRNRISLSMKQALPDPWTGVDRQFPPGTRLKVRVVKLADFGAFAEVKQGVNGLIPLGEMSWSHRPGKPEEVVSIGQDVEVVVLNVDAKRRRIGLSIKQVTEDPWRTVEQDFPVHALVTGCVTKILEFGVLVRLREGIEGMIHISELAHQRVRTAGDVVNVGDEISIKVLAVDSQKRRIALSLKAAAEPPPEEPKPAEKAAPKRKKQKPLRGGLASHFDW